jgi:pantoate--beta-alanine ligase
VIASPADLAEACGALRATRTSLGFVATMGAFHEGHRSLIRLAREERDAVVVSIFVNPLQFGPGEDLAAYPRDLERDLALAREDGVDVAFTPEMEAMYPGGRPAVTVDPGSLGDRLEGASRPGHFAGVCTVVAKLFHLVGRSTAYFGEKDFQQLAILRRMARDLSFPVEVVGCPVVREPDGLAMSSRNRYLSPSERSAATVLFSALSDAATGVRDGDDQALRVAERMADAIRAEPLARLDYAAVLDEETLTDVEVVDQPARALVAARFGTTRLIDNLRLEL